MPREQGVLLFGGWHGGNPLKRLQQHVDISWFIPCLIKYSKFFGEVILVSFFLRLFALATPLFFRMVMDKVLVRKGFTTLDVLAFGFLVVAIFEAILGGRIGNRMVGTWWSAITCSDIDGNRTAR